MCLIFFSYKQNPKYPLIVLANRDEFYNREASAAHFWKEHPYVLAGKDLKGGGTWLGVTKSGQLAMLTNYRDLTKIKPHAPTRGKLVLDYLIGSEKAQDYLLTLDKRAEAYNGYNIILGTVDSPLYYSNEQRKIHQLKPGLYGLSNHLLDTEWPKVESGKKELAAISMESKLDIGALFNIMMDKTIAPDNSLPKTGIEVELERSLSAKFIQIPSYGTRCTTLFFMDNDRNLTFIERSYLPDTNSYTEASFQFKII